MDGSASPSNSSGISSLGSSLNTHKRDNLTEAEALLQLSNNLQESADEGIVSDQSSSTGDPPSDLEGKRIKVGRECDIKRAFWGEEGGL